MSDFNPYEILGVDIAATKKDIKQAYRRKSKESHPDAGLTKDNTDFFNIRKAYDLLMDDMTRAYFDTTGKTDIKRSDVEKAGHTLIESNLESIMDFVISNNVELERFNLSEGMRNMLLEQKGVIQDKLRKLKHKINVVRRLSSKTRRTDGGRHIYRMIFAKKSAVLSAELNRLNMALLAGDFAIEEAKQFVDGEDHMLALEMDHESL